MTYSLLHVGPGQNGPIFTKERMCTCVGMQDAGV